MEDGEEGQEEENPYTIFNSLCLYKQQQQQQKNGDFTSTKVQILPAAPPH
jgi:hypothetical protein